MCVCVCVCVWVGVVGLVYRCRCVYTCVRYAERMCSLECVLYTCERYAERETEIEKERERET